MNLCVSGLRRLSVSELTETLEEVETAIRRYSEELIQALALRDELDYEKEVLDLSELSSYLWDFPCVQTLQAFLNAGEEQLHLAADRGAEQAEGAPGAAAQKEEVQKHHHNGAQRPEDQQHARPGDGEWRDRPSFGG